MVPRNASTIPTEPMITYFHDASSEARFRRCPTRNAVATVVPSMATHMTAEVSGEHREQHRGDEQWQQQSEESRRSQVGVTEGELGVDVSDRGPHCEERYARDEEDHEPGERVGA